MERQLLLLLYMLVLCANLVVSYPQPLKEEQQMDIYQPSDFIDSGSSQPAALLNSQGLPPLLGNSPVDWLYNQGSSRQLRKPPPQGLKSEELSSQLKNPPIDWLYSQGLPLKLGNPPVEWLNSHGLSSELRNPPAKWLNSHGFFPQYQSAGLFHESPQYQPLETINTQNQPNVNYYDTTNNVPRGFNYNLQEQWQMDQPKPQSQLYPNFEKPEMVNNYQELQFVVPDNQELPKQYKNDLAWSSNVHNSHQNYEEANPQVLQHDKNIPQNFFSIKSENNRPINGSALHQQQSHDNFRKLFTPIINNDLGYQPDIRSPIPPKEISNFQNNRQSRLPLNQSNHLTNPDNTQLPVTSYQSSPPKEPLYIEPITPTTYPPYAPVVNKTAVLDMDSYNPILQNNRSQTALEKDSLTSNHKRYIVVHRNGTFEFIDNLNDIIVDDFDIAHIKSKDGLNPILAVIEVEDKIEETEDKKPSNLPYDTGISNIPQAGNLNTNYPNIPDDLSQNPVSKIQMTNEDTDMKYFIPEYIMPIESTTQYIENVVTKNDLERLTKTDISYLKPEYISPLKSTTENSIDKSADIELPTSEYNGSIHNNNISALKTGDFDINKFKSEYFVQTEPTTTNRVESATYTAQLMWKDNNPHALNNTKGVDSQSEYFTPTESFTEYPYYSVNNTTEKGFKSTEHINTNPYIARKIENSDKNDNRTKYIMPRQFVSGENSITSTSDTPIYIGNTDFGNGQQFSYDGSATAPMNSNSPLYKGLETTPLSTTMVNLLNDPATTNHQTFAFDTKKITGTESLDDNKPLNRVYRKLKDEYGIDATSDLKAEFGQSIILFRPDENFFNKLVNGENPYKTVAIYDVNCKPKVIERYTTVHHFPNGTEVIDYVETVWDKPGDLNPIEVKTHRIVKNLGE